jgi:hypothetical protein
MSGIKGRPKDWRRPMRGGEANRRAPGLMRGNDWLRSCEANGEAKAGIVRLAHVWGGGYVLKPACGSAHEISLE